MRTSPSSFFHTWTLFSPVYNKSGPEYRWSRPLATCDWSDRSERCRSLWLPGVTKIAGTRVIGCDQFLSLALRPLFLQRNREPTSHDFETSHPAKMPPYFPSEGQADQMHQRSSSSVTAGTQARPQTTAVLFLRTEATVKDNQTLFGHRTQRSSPKSSTCPLATFVQGVVSKLFVHHWRQAGKNLVTTHVLSKRKQSSVTTDAKTPVQGQLHSKFSLSKFDPHQ